MRPWHDQEVEALTCIGRTMRSGSIVTLAMLTGLAFAGPSDGRAELGGCPPPQEMASASRRMNFPGADWRALTPEKIRGGWQELLNQVECPERPAGIYVLSSFAGSSTTSPSVRPRSPSGSTPSSAASG